MLRLGVCPYRFGSRARGLKNTVAVHVRLNAEVLQQQLEKAKAQVGSSANGDRLLGVQRYVLP
jgi:hypothetical protein